jgi:hypothetical protein
LLLQLQPLLLQILLLQLLLSILQLLLQLLLLLPLLLSILQPLLELLPMLWHCCWSSLDPLGRSLKISFAAQFERFVSLNTDFRSNFLLGLLRYHKECVDHEIDLHQQQHSRQC